MNMNTSLLTLQTIYFQKKRPESNKNYFKTDLENIS